MTGHTRPCPDGGKCHHACHAACFRVLACGPLTAAGYPGNRWPAVIAAAETALDLADTYPGGWPPAAVLDWLILHGPHLPAASVPLPTVSHPLGQARAIDARSREGHLCAMCPGQVPATRAVLCGPSELFGPARWLDVCDRHFGALMRYGNWAGPRSPEAAGVIDRWRKLAEAMRS